MHEKPQQGGIEGNTGGYSKEISQLQQKHLIRQRDSVEIKTKAKRNTHDKLEREKKKKKRRQQKAPVRKGDIQKST